MPLRASPPQRVAAPRCPFGGCRGTPTSRSLSFRGDFVYLFISSSRSLALRSCDRAAPAAISFFYLRRGGAPLAQYGVCEHIVRASSSTIPAKRLQQQTSPRSAHQDITRPILGRSLPLYFCNMLTLSVAICNYVPITQRQGYGF